MESKELAYRKTLATIGMQLNGQDLSSIRFICKAVEGLTKRDRELEDPLEFFVKLEERGVLSPDDTDFLAELLRLVGRKDCLALLEGYQRATGARPIAASGASLGVGVDATDSVPSRMPVQTTSLAAGTPVAATDGLGSGSSGYGRPQAVVTNGMAGRAHTRGPVAKDSGSFYPEDLSEAFETVVEEVGRNWRQLARKLRLREAELDWIAGDHPLNMREQCMQSLLLWQRKAPSQATKSALIQALRSCRMMYVADLLEGYQFR